MKIKFTDEDKNLIKEIIEKYRNISGELAMYQVEAEKIQDKVISLNKNLEDIKEQEKKLMIELHKKYGEFGLQDIYDTIN